MNIRKLFKKQVPHPKVVRVYDWSWTRVYGWDTISIVDHESINRIFHHLQTAKSMEIFVGYNFVYYRAETEKFGTVEGSWDTSLLEFQFRIVKYCTVYKILYELTSKKRSVEDISEFIEWLKSFKSYIDEFEKEREL